MVDIHVKLCRLVSEKGPFWPKNGIGSNLIAYKFPKFSGGACPHTPLLLHAYTHAYTCTTNLATPNLMATALPTEARSSVSSTGSSIQSQFLVRSSNVQLRLHKYNAKSSAAVMISQHFGICNKYCSSCAQFLMQGLVYGLLTDNRE